MDTSLYKKKLTLFKERFSFVYKSLTPEKVLTLHVLGVFAVISFFTSLVIFNAKFLITVPTYGGEIHEGIIGTPRFINPILATSDQDKDLTTLVFTGLTKKTSDGNYVFDIAERIEQSEDGLRFTAVLKNTAFFHDGTPVTSEDIQYTVGLIQNPLIKSPHRVEWEGVTTEIVSEKEIVFILKKPFPLFMKTLSVGIIPKHIWKNLTEEQISLSDFNIHAIGSGPYKIKTIKKESGIPVYFTLLAHERYTLGRPYIETINISTYQNERYLLKALADKDITRIHGISPEKVKELSLATSSVETTLLPRTFAIFFNPNKLNSLANKEVRQALQFGTDKQKILTDVLHGYGKALSEPYPFDENQTEHIYDPVKAKDLLIETKTLKDASSTLDITLATANTDEMKKIAEIIKNDWALLGVNVTIAIYEVSDLNQTIIKDRDFQVLLFGAITETPSDLYAFWHSSQRTYPGLNISNYVSKKLDENLEILRSSIDPLEQTSAYEAVRGEFKEEVPGIFLYAPALMYINQDKVVSPLPLFGKENASRFLLIETWYRYTDKIWPTTYYKPLSEALHNIIH